MSRFLGGHGGPAAKLMNLVEIVLSPFDLSHLAPFRFTADSAKAGKPLVIFARFSNHCYSEAFDSGSHDPNGAVIMDGRKRRVFSPLRHRLSLLLPGLVKGLSAPGIRVHETMARRNWMYAVTVDIPEAGTRYQIFFDLRRAPAERRQSQDLEMMVESAYPADPERARPNILGRVGFLLLAGSVYTGRKVMTRR